MHRVDRGLILAGNGYCKRNCKFRWFRKICQKQDVLKGKPHPSFDGAHGPPRQPQSTPKPERHAVIHVT